ncbi:MAG: MBOAT family protein, partial [Candidatus Delongbacteria bacterium]|nr:MBOAT family protein [Candidatus Delongbacteria bacterium]
MKHAFDYIGGIFSRSLFANPELPSKAFQSLRLIILFVIIEWIGRKEEFAIENLKLYKYKIPKWIFYYAIILVIYIWGNYSETIEFIYFQF